MLFYIDLPFQADSIPKPGIKNLESLAYYLIK